MSGGRSGAGTTSGSGGSARAGESGGSGAGTGGTSASKGGTAAGSNAGTGDSGAGSGSNTGGAGAALGGSGASTGGTIDPTGGTGGSDTQGGTGGQIAGDHCNFRVKHSQSSAIGTVTIVTWSTDLSELSEAHIDFGPADADLAMKAPVALELEGNRTLLLGMKAAKNYSFRIVASNAADTCTSPAFEVTTGPLPDNLPIIDKSEQRTGGVKGFFLTTPGIGAAVRGLPSAYIFDTDGDIVWWTPESVEQTGCARMSWDGQAMWIVAASSGGLYRTTMDGLSTTRFTGDAASATHDIAPLPEGGVATLGHVGGKDVLIAVNDAGAVEPIVVMEDLYASPNSYHPNALAYHPADDSFTIGDLNLDGFVKIKRDGELVWQLGGQSPKAQSFELVGLEPWDGNHGHDLGPDGQFLFFNNFAPAGTMIFELDLDEAALTATKVWDYGFSTRSQYLGGVQRLPNGDTSIVVSQAGVIYEVNPAGEVVQSFSNYEFNADRDLTEWALFGYAGFRPTLYGPPTSTWPAR